MKNLWKWETRGSIAIHFSFCLRIVYVHGWSGRDGWCAFVTHGLVFLNYRLKVNSKLFHYSTFSGVCVSSGTPLRMYFIKWHWFVLSVPARRLFVCIGEVTHPFSCYIPFQVHAGSKCRSTDENGKLTNCLRSALSCLRHLCVERRWSLSWKSGCASSFKNVVVRHADVCGWSQAARRSIPPWFSVSLPPPGARAYPFSSIILVPFRSP